MRTTISGNIIIYVTNHIRYNKGILRTDEDREQLIVAITSALNT